MRNKLFRESFSERAADPSSNDFQGTPKTLKQSENISIAVLTVNAKDLM